MKVYLVWKRTAPMGLLTTTYRSTEMTPIVHRLAIPSRTQHHFIWVGQKNEKLSLPLIF